MEKSFKPHPSMVKLFDYYLLMAIMPEIIVGLIVTLLVYMLDPLYAYIPAVSFFIPIALITSFAFYWIRKYYQSINQLSAHPRRGSR